MMLMDWIIFALTVLSCMTGLCFSLVAARYANASKLKWEQLNRIERKMNELEEDFGDKWDEYVRRVSSRQSMREKRSQKEEPKDLNKPNGGLLTYGPPQFPQ